MILLGQLLVTFGSCDLQERPSDAPKQPPIVLISIDTLRSDRLPAYGYRQIATPHLDQLAADGVVYEQAFSHVPLTLPSHASLFTGLLPTEHGVRDNAGYTLAAERTTLATRLRSEGYATGAAVSAYVLRAGTGLAEGFDSYDDKIAFIEGAPTGNLQRPGGETVAIAKQWITTNAAKPFFAFVHLFEPHAPYEPTYDAEIVKSDALVGELLDTLRAQNLYDDALIVVLSDHGEGLMDHGEQEHGVLLYREALQVPLIVKWPANEKRGTRVKEAIGLKDVAALALSVVRPLSGKPLSVVRGPLSGPGADAKRTDNGQRTTDNAIYAETLYPRLHLGWAELRSVIRYPHHLIEGPKPELYDLARDPRETQNLRETQRRDYAALREELAKVPQPAASAPRIDPEEAKKLAALGYVSAQSPTTRSDLNPRDHLGDLVELKTVTELMQQRDFAAAASRIESLLERNPGWSDLRDQLGVAYESLGNLPSAERAYRDAIRTTPELAGTFALSLSSVLLSQGKLDDAEAHAKLALTANPPAAHELLGHIALARGDYDTALREASVAKSDFLIAQIQAARGELEPAIATLRRIYDHSHTTRTPLPPDYFFLTGDVFARAGRTREARIAFEKQIGITPQNRDAYVRLALLQRIDGDLPASARTLQAMVAANPDEGTRRLAATVAAEWEKGRPK